MESVSILGAVKKTTETKLYLEESNKLNVPVSYSTESMTRLL